jgi:hypothetical protein
MCPLYLPNSPSAAEPVGFGPLHRYMIDFARLKASRAEVFLDALPLDELLLTIQKGVWKWQDYVTERHLACPGPLPPHPQNIVHIDIHHEH